MEKTKKFCPCCSFDLDLFLPDSEKQVKAGIGNRNESVNNNENNSSLLAPLPQISEIFEGMMKNNQIENHDLQDEPNQPIVIVDTHGHAQLDRERDETYSLEALEKQRSGQSCDNLAQFHVKSLACSVEPADFDATLKYAAKSDSILPALGVHPWYIENLPGYSSSQVIDGNSNGIQNDGIDFDTLDKEWLDPLEQSLLQHPNCLVGEIGLCKIAKWVRTHPDGKSAAMAIQKRIFKKQMMLAARLRRPVSVHCVNSHGIFVSAINELLERKIEEDDIAAVGSKDDIISKDSRRLLLPPAIAMHSFTGTAHHVNELLDLEQNIDFPHHSRAKRKKKKSPKNPETTTNEDEASPLPPPKPPLFYFGFSHTVNYVMCTSEKSRKKGKEAVQAVPLDRLLVESDVHSDVDVAGGTLGAISYVAWARKMQLRETMAITSKNGSSFFGSIRS